MSKSKRDFGLYALPVLRIGVSALMLIHGISKLEKLLKAEPIKFYNFLGLGAELSLILAVIGELLAPVMIIIGFQTRFSALIAAVTMAVAAFGAHAGDPLEDREHSLLYLVAFIAITLAGAGRWSLDNYFSGRKPLKK